MPNPCPEVDFFYAIRLFMPRNLTFSHFADENSAHLVELYLDVDITKFTEENKVHGTEDCEEPINTCDYTCICVRVFTVKDD